MTREALERDIGTEVRSYDDYVRLVTDFMDNHGIEGDINSLLWVALHRKSGALVDAISSVLGPRQSFYGVAKRGDHAVVEESVDLITDILLQPWHGAHEDLVAELEHFPHLKTVETLRHMVEMKPPVLAQIDQADALSRRAIWGLGKMALPLDARQSDPEVADAAVNALRRLLHHPDHSVVERARKQLDRIAHANKL
ncbi:hypothetical protein [Xanthomonas sp. 3075]|uniref:hypothetical protein n=1 Tax=Xanthomonas sp. 3075 TaxID=3035315 RepID=UPI00160D6DE7|nr:hypothetical protein [Xanthomonas sp. 3075]MBB4132439.1 hypothetical protein [Xanthomonas sp. 3075]